VQPFMALEPNNRICCWPRWMTKGLLTFSSIHSFKAILLGLEQQFQQNWCCVTLGRSVNLSEPLQ
jgi:hypothetical protein